jgi:CRP-like cAMP-binding protein
MNFSPETFLEHFHRPEFSQVHSTFSSRSYSRHAYISQPGNTDNAVFVITKGRVRVYLGHEDKEFNLAILAAGDIFPTHTSAYVQAMEDVEILTAGIAAFQRLMACNQEINGVTIRMLGNMLKTSFAIIDRLVFKKAPCRLLALLLAEAKRQEKGHDGEIVLDLNLSVEHIAKLVGASRQTVSTEINKLIRNGIVRRKNRRTFIVPDIAALERQYKRSSFL